MAMTPLQSWGMLVLLLIFAGGLAYIIAALTGERVTVTEKDNMEQDLDLSTAERPGTYSAHSLGLADYAIRNGQVRHTPGELRAYCKSLSSENEWVPIAVVNNSGEVLGVTCNCPNGTKGGLRARCWHSAALEILLERIENPHEKK